MDSQLSVKPDRLLMSLFAGFAVVIMLLDFRNRTSPVTGFRKLCGAEYNKNPFSAHQNGLHLFNCKFNLYRS